MPTGSPGPRAATARACWADYCCVQQRHTYLPPRPGASFDPQVAANDDLLDYCRAQGVLLLVYSALLLVYSALLSGAYARPDRSMPGHYISPDNDRRLQVLHSDPPVLPLIAASSLDHLRENIGALHVRLSAEHMNRLDDTLV